MIKWNKYLFIICFCSLFLANINLGLAWRVEPIKSEPCKFEVKQSWLSSLWRGNIEKICRILRGPEGEFIWIEIDFYATPYSEFERETIEALYRSQIRERIASLMDSPDYDPSVPLDVYILIEVRVFSASENDGVPSEAHIFYRVTPGTIQRIVIELLEESRND